MPDVKTDQPGPAVAERTPAADPFPPQPQAGALARRDITRDTTMAESFTGLMPSSIGEALQLAQTLARGGNAVPYVYRGNPEGTFMVILAGIELGLTPIRALQSLVPISGSLAMKADLQLALARRSGALLFFDEGFELAGVSDVDSNLVNRLRRHGRTDDERDEFGGLADTILDLTDDVPDGKPYGWAIAQRKGDPQRHVRVFSFLDAERFTYTEWEGEGQARKSATKKLSEKHAYVHNPQDMYPKRARVRVLQITHSDVLAGMPAIEAMDADVVNGTVIEGQAMTPTPASSEDAIQAALDAIKATDAALATSIVAGFDQMEMGIAKRLQLLRKYPDDPKALAEFLRDEYASRRSRGRFGRVKDGETAGDPKPAEATGASGTTPAPADTKPAAPETTTAQAGTAATAASTVRQVADRFKGGKRTI